MQKLIGIFGGTFDPIHLGHLNAINELQAHAKFARIHWVLSARPPHKDAVSADIEQRFAMLQLALADQTEYVADDTEIKREDKSYTLTTVQHFQQLYPDYQLCLIIGGDSLARLHSWYRYEELIDLVHIVVMARPGYDLSVPDFLKDRCETIDDLAEQTEPKLVLYTQSQYNISSTEIRDLLTKPKLGTNEQLTKWLPPTVIDYISTHQSYKIAAMNAEQIKDQVVEILEGLKGQDIRVLHIAELSDFADYMVVVSGTSDTHVRALAREASDGLRKSGVKPINETGAELGEWVLVDFADVVLHVMRPAVREYYDLEKLWDEDVREMVKQHREKQET